jgi:DNA-binding NarL/FixJ family response regulator
MISVLLSGGYPLIRAGIRHILIQDSEIKLVGEASTFKETIQLCTQFRPAILLACHSSIRSTTKIVDYITSQSIPIKIIILSPHLNNESTQPLMKLAVCGYMLIDESSETVLNAIRVISQGGQWYSQSWREILMMQSDQQKEVTRQITPRELQVFQLLSEGMTDLQISDILNITKRTVRHHISSILIKTQAKNRTEAVHKGMSLGWDKQKSIS